MDGGEEGGDTTVDYLLFIEARILHEDKGVLLHLISFFSRKNNCKCVILMN